MSEMVELRERVVELERALLRIRDSQESDLGIYAKFCHEEAVNMIGKAWPQFPPEEARP